MRVCVCVCTCACERPCVRSFVRACVRECIFQGVSCYGREGSDRPPGAVALREGVEWSVWPPGAVATCSSPSGQRFCSLLQGANSCYSFATRVRFVCETLAPRVRFAYETRIVLRCVR